METLPESKRRSDVALVLGWGGADSLALEKPKYKSYGLPLSLDSQKSGWWWWGGCGWVMGEIESDLNVKLRPS